MVQYYKFGLCADDLERWIRRFPKNQLHLILFEDLIRRPLETTQGVFKFLEVDSSFVPRFTVKNPTWNPLSVRLQHALATRTRMPPGAVSDLPPRWRDQFVYPIVGGLNLLGGTLRKRRFNPETRRALLARYRQDILKTEALIGRSLRGWLDGV